MEQNPQPHNHSWPGTANNLVHRHPVEDGHPLPLADAHPPELPDPPAQIDNAAYRIVVDSGLSMTMEQGDALHAMAADELHASWLAGYQAGQRESEPRAGK